MASSLISIKRKKSRANLPRTSCYAHVRGEHTASASDIRFTMRLRISDKILFESWHNHLMKKRILVLVVIAAQMVLFKYTESAHPVSGIVSGTSNVRQPPQDGKVAVLAGLAPEEDKPGAKIHRFAGSQAGA